MGMTFYRIGREGAFGGAFLGATGDADRHGATFCPSL